MNELKVLDSEGNEIHFVGELVAEVNRTVELDDKLARTIELQIYAIEKGGFIAVADYESTCPNEASTRWCETVDLKDDIEKFFFAFDLFESFEPHFGLSRADKEILKRNSRQIAREYESASFRLLDDALIAISSHKYRDKADEKKQEKSVFWSLFKSD